MTLMYVWQEAPVKWPSLGVDRAAAIPTQNVELVAGANAGPLWIGICGVRGICDIVLEGSFYRFRDPAEIRSQASSTRSSACSKLTGIGVFGGGIS